MKQTNKFPWDSYSDQPHILKRDLKKSLRKGHFIPFLKLMVTNLFYFPYLFIKFILTKNTKSVQKHTKKFYGLCVNLDKGDIQYALVEELGVSSLQIRVFLNDINNIDQYVKFAKGFGTNKQILITIIQDRENIINKQLLQQNIITIFEKFANITDEFMIGNAINRIKWGFVDMDEYLQFYQTVYNIRNKLFPKYKLIGSSVIDFEYHFTIRTLYNNYKLYYDKIASLLYVDRRGSPYSTQMGIFNLYNKIKFLHTIVKSSSKSNNNIYITETNWPRSNTAPYAPTSEKECVDTQDYDKYMLEYFDIAKQTNNIEKVFWHQLIAPGYGLIDNRENQLKKTSAYYLFQKLIQECEE